jgi:hypothetical protein
MLFGETGQHVHGIVADGKDRDVLALEVGLAALQLDELRLAERSPASAPMEHHQGTPASSSCVEVDGTPVLVWQNDVGEPVPNRRSDRGKVEGHARSSLS